MKAVTRILKSVLPPLLLSGISLTAHAAYPTKQITIVVPFTPGSATDVIARAIGDHMAKDLGQAVVVENRPGAGGTIGSAAVAKAAPDGYTLLVNSNAHAANPALYSKLPYDTLKDFRGVTTLATLPNVLITSGKSSYTTVSSLVEAARKKPGMLNYASAGAGSATHVNAEKFRTQAGIDVIHVPFSGTPPAVTQTVANEVDYMFAPIMATLSHVKSGSLRALAVGSAGRSALLPDVPTTVEAGVPNSDFNFWIGLIAPAKTPDDVVAKLYESASKALATDEVKQRFLTLGAEPYVMKPAEFDGYIKSETVSLGEIIQRAGVKLN